MKLELCFQSHNIDLTIKEFLNQNQQEIYDLANLILVFFLRVLTLSVKGDLIPSAIKVVQV